MTCAVGVLGWVFAIFLFGLCAWACWDWRGTLDAWASTIDQLGDVERQYILALKALALEGGPDTVMLPAPLQAAVDRLKEREEYPYDESAANQWSAVIKEAGR